MVLQKCNFSRNMVKTAEKIQRRYKYLTGFTTAPNIMNYYNETYFRKIGISTDDRMNGFDIMAKPYGTGANHIGHALSAVSFKGVLYCFNPWGKYSLSSKDIPIFNQIKKDWNLKKIIVYKGPDLQKNNKNGVCVAYAANFILEMFIFIRQNKLNYGIGQSEFDILIQFLLQKRGICFGGKCINKQMKHNLLAVPTPTPEQLKLFSYTNLQNYAKEIGVSNLGIPKSKDVLINDIIKAQVKKIKNFGISPPIPNNNRVRVKKMKVANLKQYAKNKGIKLPPGRLLKANLQKLILNKSPSPVVLQDWRKVAIESVENGYPILTIPKGTLIYKGVGIINPKGFDMGYGKFYGSFPTAAIYAYETSRATHGKVIVYKTTDNVKLLNMAKIETYKKLSSRFGTNIVKNKMQPFGYLIDSNNLYRESYANSNKEATNWICNKVLNTTGIKGYAYKGMKGFHEEIMMCGEAIKQPITKLSTEYRFVPYYNDKSFLEIKNRKYTGKTIKILNTKIDYINHKNHIINPYYTVYDMDNLIKNMKRLKMDNFIFESPIKEYTNKYIK